MAACDGFRPLVASVLDGALHAELAEPVLLTLLHLADHPRTRRQFRPFLELQAVLAPFTALDAAVRAPERAALLEVRDGVYIWTLTSLRGSSYPPLTPRLLTNPHITKGGPPRAPHSPPQLGGGHTAGGAQRAEGAPRPPAGSVGRRSRRPGGAPGGV